MPLSGRTLRPANNAFTPKSISGLALWLDGADSSTTYTTDAGAVTAVSSPLDLSGCVGWWDSSDLSAMKQEIDGTGSVAVGDPVGYWADKSPTGAHLAASTTARRPTLTASAVNGRSALVFSAASSTSLNRSLYTATNGLSGLTRIAVCQSTLNNVSMMARNFNGGSSDFMYMNGAIRIGYDSTAATNFMAGTSVSSNGSVALNVYSDTFAGGSPSTTAFYSGGLSQPMTLYGTLPSTTGSGTPSLYVGSNSDANFFWTGPIAEYIIFNRTLTRAELASVEKYLADKWGIGSVHRSAKEELAVLSSPTELAGCVGWWDASDATTITQSGGLVSQITDKSGGGNTATQPSSGSQPTLVSNALNGKSLLRFDGSRSLNGNFSTSVSTNAYSIFLVCKMSGTVTNGRMFSAGGASADYASGSIIPCCANATSGDSLSSYNGTTGTNVGVVSGFSSYGIFAGVCGVSSLTNTANGTTSATGSVTLTNALTRFAIGQPIGGGAGGIIGDIAEIILFNNALSSVARARVEKYLAAKWGIANVPDPTPPVGAWLDKSGNARHATQGTASYRPVVQTNAIASRTALKFDGSNDWLATANINSVFPSAATAFIVCYPSASSSTNWTVFSTGANHWDVYSGALTYAGTFRSPRVNGIATSIKYNAGEPLILRYRSSSASWSQFVNGLASVETAGAYNATSGNYSPAAGNAGIGYTIGSDLSGATINGSFKDYICEVLLYNSSLSDADCKRVERQLAAKWSASLRPSVSNADAQDWIRRVYINGGTVSASTAAAVNTFCDAIDYGVSGASIRDRFYRLNLFCGGTSGTAVGLNSALVPLYLTPDKTVTNLFQFGTDQTNAAWLAGGNGLVTRTATTEVGPLGYGYATKLTTPTSPFDIRQMYQQMPLDGRQVTVSAWMKTNSGTRQIQWLTGNSYSDTVTVTTTWQRFTKTFTLPTSTDARTGLSTVSELSDDKGFIYVWGMQCEYGEAANSYSQPRYGNTTDLNSGGLFAGADYSESAGLTGNGSTGNKFLNPGTLATLKPSWVTHHFGIDISGAFPDATNRYLMGAFFNETPTSPRGSYAINGYNTSSRVDSGMPSRGAYTTASNLKWAIRSSASDLRAYEDNTQSGSTQSAVDTASVLPGGAFAIMASSYQNVSAGTPTNIVNGYAHSVGTCRGYTIGEAMDATQRSAFVSAWIAFQQAMGRR